jgi:transmembrane sensor
MKSMARASQIEKQAARWVTWVDSGAESADRQADFIAWLVADSHHRAAYRTLSRAWRRMDILSKLRNADFAPISPPPRRQRNYVPALALTALGVIAVAVVLRWMGSPEPQWNMYRTGRGALQSLTLADGSSVTLNTDSELHVQAAASRRTVRLIRGEALFDVRHDPARLFEVATGNIRVKDIGTEFSIRRLDERHVQVLVKDGKVRIERVALAAEGQSKTVASVDLAAGETIVVDEGRTDLYMGEIRKLPVTEVERKLEWTDGRIAFSGESLSEAIAEFNRYNQRQLWVADAGIGQLRIGGQFDATDFDGFVKTLNKAYGLHGQRAAKPGDIVLTR